MLVFDWVDDEQCNIRWGDSTIINVNHDEDGWNGMERIINSLKELADLNGIEWREKGDPNV